MNSAVSDLFMRPLASLMTLLVIAVALALPATLLAILDLGSHLVNDWDEQQSVTLFLKQEIDAESALSLSASIEEMDGVASAELRTSGDALAEFRIYSGFGDALNALDENPLPNLLLINPEETIDGERLEQIVKQLKQLPEADLVEYDQLWIERLESITATGKRLVQALGIILGLAVLMIIGNTIRLEISTRHSEIEIAKLVGGTNGFIRRPFLYTGFLYGSIGALTAWLLVALLLITLNEPLGRLEELYSTDLPLNAFDLLRLSYLFPSGIILGLVGAWLAVGRQLLNINPE